MIIENLETILESKTLIIRNENWLLNVLMRWYKNKESRISEENEKKELKKDFEKLLLKYIHLDSLKMDEIEESVLNELKILELNDYINEMKNKPKHKEVNLVELNDERIEDIILKYYENEEELINEEDLRILNNYDIISILLENENIKMIEIGILIIIESRSDFKSIYINNF